MVDLAYCLKKLLVFGIPVIYFYINLKLLITFCLLCSEDIYISLGISLSCSFVTIFEFFCGEVLEVFVTLSVILLPIKPPAAY